MFDHKGLCVWLPYQLLISSSMVLGNVTLILVFIAYVVLKKKHPDGSRWGPWLVCALSSHASHD